MDTKIAISMFLGGLLVACNSNKEETQEASTAQTAVEAPAAAPAAAQPTVSADTYYSQKCMACHGESGKGDGPGAAALDPKPRDYTDAAWQDSVTDEDLKKVIVSGGMAVGKSPLMPGSPDLKDKPELVDALVKKVRGFKK